MRALTTTLFALTIAQAASGEGHPASLYVSEIVTFRLIDGTDPAAFVNAADDMGPFLRSTGAMIKRTLSVDDTGLWTDHIVWTSLDAAKSAAGAMFERPEAAPFMAMIAPDGMDMRHATIQLQQE